MLVEGVNYDIQWKKFRPGMSIFIPCLNPKAARAQLMVVTKRLKIKILTKVVIENGIRGLRVWRERV